ncbi:hypothetical protein GCM10010182_67620 [Actinomadura cremea]|nr:hypothetical protein GCM10010182_67620 [Actinomadura cremea]
MKLVRMTHPDVGESEVPESAVPHWRASGWRVAEEKPVEHIEVKKPLGDQGEEAPPRRRRAKEAE